jgi:hypothetical protein
MKTKSEYLLLVDEELWFTLFGLECTLGVEFDASATESIFLSESKEDTRGGCYTLYNGRGLIVSAKIESDELGLVLLSVEADKAFTPSLTEIMERAKYQAFRRQRWQKYRESVRWQGDFDEC